MAATLIAHFRTMADRHYADSLKPTLSADMRAWHTAECNRYARAASYLYSRNR